MAQGIQLNVYHAYIWNMAPGMQVRKLQYTGMENLKVDTWRKSCTCMPHSMEIGKNIFNMYSKQPKWPTATEIILVWHPAITFSICKCTAPFYGINS
jgi:hypothetical protein